MGHLPLISQTIQDEQGPTHKQHSLMNSYSWHTNVANQLRADTGCYLEDLLRETNVKKESRESVFSGILDNNEILRIITKLYCIENFGA